MDDTYKRFSEASELAEDLGVALFVLRISKGWFSEPLVLAEAERLLPEWRRVFSPTAIILPLRAHISCMPCYDRPDEADVCY